MHYFSGDSTGAFMTGRRYVGEDLTFDLPAGMDVCEVSTFTIWSEAFRVIFTRLLIPASTFVSFQRESEYEKGIQKEGMKCHQTLHALHMVHGVQL